MAAQYAKTQPAGFKNYVQNIAIIGAGGRSGRVMVNALVNGNKHRVTAITRPDSTSKLPDGLHDIKQANYEEKASLVDALRGQDVMIVTMNIRANPDDQKKLINAAIEAGVPWIMPNEWAGDMSNVELANETMMRDRLVPIREYIEKFGGDKTHWIGLCCGFWYEFSLAGTEARYGFDFDQKTLVLYDDGNTKISHSTWPQVGRAVVNLWSLKILPDDENDMSPTLSQFKNKPVHISSFEASQRDMFQSVLRVTGDNESDWKVTYEDVEERYNRGKQMLLKEGKMLGYGILLYARCFYRNGGGDFSHKLDNDILGLPKESFDEATNVAIEMAHYGNHNVIS